MASSNPVGSDGVRPSLHAFDLLEIELDRGRATEDRDADLDARLVEVDAPFPVAHEDEIVAAFVTGISERTTLAVIDHITSPTGIIFPIEKMIAACKSRGIAVLIDGAHAPGMVELNLDALGADWYTGNCHKWLFAPKGCAFLWTHPSRQAETHPTVISHKYKVSYTEEFDWTGTQDFSAFLTVPYALEFYNKQDFPVPYRLDKTSLQYQGHTVWYKRCSALVSGRTHYSLCPQVDNPFSRDYQRILHLKLTISLV